MPSTDRTIWMKLYIGDFLAAVEDFDADEGFAYILLLIHYWKHGPLPNDDKRLARIARIPLGKWKVSTSHAVMREFDLQIHEDIELWHLDKLDKALIQRDGKSMRAKDAAILRWKGRGKKE